MSAVVITGDTSGTVTLQAPAVAGTTTLTLPTTDGTIVTTSGAQTIEFADGSASAPSITNSGDTNTGIFFPAADTIAFAEGGTEAMRIDSSGNVGIGTTSAYGSARLSVSGSVTATGGWTGTNSSAGRLGGTIMSFACERTSIGTAGQVMAFGNGNGTMKGLRMPFAGKLIAATLSGITVTGTITVQAFLNNVANASYELTGTGSASDIGVTQDFSASPLSFAAGSTLGWYQQTVPTTANGYNVSFYVVFD